MCKIMMFAGIKPRNVMRAWKWSAVAAPLLSETDKDGFGYAASAGDDIFGERWVNPEDSFKRKSPLSRAERHMRAQFGSAVNIPDTYNRFGDVAKMPDAQAIMLHARWATCAKGLSNIHPFTHEVDGKPVAALIHNGVISNQATLTNKTSTCDSECILNEYGESGVARLPENIQDVADMLRGYYACGVLAHNGAETVLDVFKSDRASLYVGWVAALGTHVFCTAEEILHETADASRMRITSVAKVREGHMIRLSAATGRVLSITEFDDEPFDVKDWVKSSVTEGTWEPKSVEPVTSTVPATPQMSLLKARGR